MQAVSSFIASVGRGVLPAAVSVGLNELSIKMATVFGRECVDNMISPPSMPWISCKALSTFADVGQGLVPVALALAPTLTALWASHARSRQASARGDSCPIQVLGGTAVVSCIVSLIFACGNAGATWKKTAVDVFATECRNGTLVPPSMPKTTCESLESAISVIRGVVDVTAACNPILLSVAIHLKR